MSTFFTDDFSGAWTDRFDVGSTFSTDWTVSSGTLTAATGAGDIGGRTLDSVTDDDDVEVLFSFQVGAVGAQYHVAMLRGSGSAGSPTCYSFSTFSSRARIYKYVGSETPTSLASTSCTLAANTTYWCRFRVNTDDITATIWADGGSEGSPIATVTVTNDTSVTGSGWAGPFQGGAQTSGSTWYQFGWGTNGDTAPSSAGGGGTYTMSAATYAPGSITATGVTPRVTRTKA